MGVKVGVNEGVGLGVGVSVEVGLGVSVGVDVGSHSWIYISANFSDLSSPRPHAGPAPSQRTTNIKRKNFINPAYSRIYTTPRISSHPSLPTAIILSPQYYFHSHPVVVRMVLSEHGYQECNVADPFRVSCCRMLLTT